MQCKAGTLPEAVDAFMSWVAGREATCARALLGQSLAFDADHRFESSHLARQTRRVSGIDDR